MSNDSRTSSGGARQSQRLDAPARWPVHQRSPMSDGRVEPETTVVLSDASPSPATSHVAPASRAAVLATDGAYRLTAVLILLTFTACGRVEQPDEPTATTRSASPAHGTGEAFTSSEARLGRALNRGMTLDGSLAAIGARGITSRFTSVHVCIYSAISDDYPDLAIELSFDYDDNRIQRLNGWELRRRQETEPYLPIPAALSRKE
jgi:hypothetical protein